MAHTFAEHAWQTIGLTQASQNPAPRSPLDLRATARMVAVGLRLCEL